MPSEDAECELLWEGNARFLFDQCWKDWSAGGLQVDDAKLRFNNSERNFASFADGSRVARACFSPQTETPIKNRQKEENLRALVYLYAVLKHDEIEARKRDLSWPELHQDFEATFWKSNPD